MKDSTTDGKKVQYQIVRYASRITKSLSKPKRRFVSQMLFGMQASLEKNVPGANEVDTPNPPPLGCPIFYSNTKSHLPRFGPFSPFTKLHTFSRGCKFICSAYLRETICTRTVASAF